MKKAIVCIAFVYVSHLVAMQEFPQNETIIDLLDAKSKQVYESITDKNIIVRVLRKGHLRVTAENVAHLMSSAVRNEVEPFDTLAQERTLISALRNITMPEVIDKLQGDIEQVQQLHHNITVQQQRIIELEEELVVVKRRAENFEVTVNRLQEDFADKQAEIGGLRAEIDRSQNEIANLRNQLDINTRHAVDLGLTVAEYNKYIEFRERIIDLLTRAQTGYDYRLLDAIFGRGLHKELLYAQREYTIAGISSNMLNTYSSGITLSDWREAGNLVIGCIGLLKGIGVSVQKADMPKVTYDIECLIRQIRQLLPVKDTTDRPKGKKNGHIKKEPRVLVGRSIDKALETIQAFRKVVSGEEIQIPYDPFEVAVEKGVDAGRLDESSGNIVPIPNSPILRRSDSEDPRFALETLVPPGS
jgi:hypothetical protein